VRGHDSLIYCAGCRRVRAGPDCLGIRGWVQLPGDRVSGADCVYNTLQHTATRCNTHCNAHIFTHCNTLQHTAAHCNTLQLAEGGYNCQVTVSAEPIVCATLCNTLQHTATHRNTHCNVPFHTLQHIATHCNTLHFAVGGYNCQVTVSAEPIVCATHCSTLQHTAPHCNTHCNAHFFTHCNTLQHTATHFNSLRAGTIAR